MENFQIIFVVETDKNAGTDSRYISKFMQLLFQNYDCCVQNHFVYMGTKSKFNTIKVKSEIKRYVKYNSKGTNYIVYCFDTDAFDTSYVELEQLKKEEKYCEENNYYFVWFCYDIECVFLGTKINSSDKVNSAKIFYQNKKEFTKEEISKMSHEKYGAIKQSNLYTIIKKIYDDIEVKKNS